MSTRGVNTIDVLNKTFPMIEVIERLQNAQKRIEVLAKECDIEHINLKFNSKSRDCFVYDNKDGSLKCIRLKNYQVLYRYNNTISAGEWVSKEAFEYIDQLGLSLGGDFDYKMDNPSYLWSYISSLLVEKFKYPIIFEAASEVEEGEWHDIIAAVEHEIINIDQIRVCDACNVVGIMKRCSVCQQAEYCSVICQKVDWKEHKRWCVAPGKARVLSTHS